MWFFCMVFGLADLLVHPTGHSVFVKHAALLQSIKVGVGTQLVPWDVSDAQVQVPEVLPLFAFNALAGRPRDGDGASLELVVLQCLHGLVRILAPVHYNKGASARYDLVDAHDVTILAKGVRQLLLVDKLGEVAHPQRGAAN